MVRVKMEQREYIILCLEDSNDWSNATTRRLVMQARPARHKMVQRRERRGTPMHTGCIRFPSQHTTTKRKPLYPDAIPLVDWRRSSLGWQQAAHLMLQPC